MLYLVLSVVIVATLVVLWIQSLPRATIRARVYRASPEEQALPPAEAEARYKDPTYVRQGHWEGDRVVSSQIVWPWTVTATPQKSP